MPIGHHPLKGSLFGNFICTDVEVVATTCVLVVTHHAQFPRGPHYVRLRTFSWFRSSTLPLRGYRLSVRGRQFRVRLSAISDNPPPDVFARHGLSPMPSAAPYNTAPFIRSLAAKLTLQKKKDISVIGKRANRSILRKGKQRRLFLCCQAGNFSRSEDPVQTRTQVIKKNPQEILVPGTILCPQGG